MKKHVTYYAFMMLTQIVNHNNGWINILGEKNPDIHTGRNILWSCIAISSHDSCCHMRLPTIRTMLG